VRRARSEGWVALLNSVGIACLLLVPPAAPVPGRTSAPLSVAIPPPLNCKGLGTVPILAVAPMVRAAAEPNPGDAGANLTFCSSVSGVTGSYTLNWSFGDGHYSSAPDPIHVYAHAENYSATLTFNSSTYNTTDQFYVYVNAPLVASASFAPASPSTSTPVYFTANVSGGTAPYVTSWNFSGHQTAEGASVNHTFGTPGTYNVTMVTNDSGAGSVVQVLEVKVHGVPTTLGTSTEVLIGTSVAAAAVALLGFGYFQWEKRRRPRLPPPSPPTTPPPPT